MFNLCLDLGGTGTRGSLFNAQQELLGQSRAGAGALSLGATTAEQSIRQIWHDITLKLSSAPQPAQVKLWVGAAGNGIAGRAATLKSKMDDFADFNSVSDGYAALIGATQGRAGALIAIGTGMAGTRLDHNGAAMLLSGWGFPAGDLGSGAWMGFEFCRCALKQLDGCNLSHKISKETLAEFLSVAGDAAYKLVDWHLSAKPKDFAKLTSIIIAGAGRNDPFCLHLLNRAAGEICDLCDAIEVAGLPVHVGGGLGQTMLPRLKKSRPDTDWQIAQFDAVAGMHIYAQGLAPIEKLQVRPGLKTIVETAQEDMACNQNHY